ncbi:MAG: DUF86 domain-containing protein [Patescibacteria group bacterium]
MSKRGAKLYIEDVKDSIQKIEDYTKGLNFGTFAKDAKTIDAVVRNLSIIGEAVKNFPNELKVEYPQIPWKEIAGIRNKAIHGYFGIDEDILWKTIKEDLPPFKKQISEMLKKYIRDSDWR